VAFVVKNRVENAKRWSDDWIDVILQPRQFSCFLPEHFREEITKPAYGKTWWRECKLAAFGVYFGWVADITNGANYYYPKARSPKQDEPMITTKAIGNHIFYRAQGG